MDIGLQILGIAVQGAGLAILYLHWRAKRGLGGFALVAGWTLIALGALPWLANVAIERGLAIAALAPMMAGLLFLTPDALPRIGAKATTKPRDHAETTALETEATSPGWWSRSLARWLGALIAAPALGVAAMAAWQAFVPGLIEDRVAFSIFALMVAWTAAQLWLLSTQRPWRANIATCVMALALGGGAFIYVGAA